MSNKPRLLSGGNPQIAKGYGDEPVQAYIEAISDWRQAACRAVDAVVTAQVPGVRKAVKWNSPLYGAPDVEGWFLSLHIFKNYVKVAFFRGALLDPVPPEPSKTPSTRYLHVHKGEALDEEQFARWVRQASALPGEKM